MGGSEIFVGLTLGGALGAVSGWVASKRSVHQPIDACIDEENTVLRYLQKDPAQWVRAYGVLHTESFTSAERRVAWSEIETSCRAVLGDEKIKDLEKALHSRDEESISLIIDNVREQTGGVALVESELQEYLKSGGNVAGSADSRSQNTERSPIRPTDTGTKPFERIYVPAGAHRLIGAAVAGAVFGAVGSWAVGLRYQGVALWLGVLSMITLAVGGIVISLVDWDTFYLDTPSFWLWASTSWAAIAAASIVDGSSKDLIIGAVSSIAVAAGFEGIARVWGKLRGITQGAGDTWIVICTAGIPALVAAEWQVAAWAVIAGAVGAAAHWIYLAAFRGANRETPLPFGPWLVAGGYAALALWAVMV